MCELFALSASAPVEIKLSLAELARHGGQTGIHTDGWGVAFLEGRDVRLIREPSAAAFSPWVQCLQDHPIQSNTVIAHIRHATKGAVELANTQPFVRELGGCACVFAHNGFLDDAVLSSKDSRQRFQPIGSTDSEAAFCLLLERMAANAGAGEPPDRNFAIFAAFARELRDHGPANIIYALDGHLFIYADRRTQRPGVIEPPGLWILQRQCTPNTELMFAGAGVSVAGTALSIVLIASVPLTSKSWRPLERSTAIEVRNGSVIMQLSV